MIRDGLVALDDIDLADRLNAEAQLRELRAAVPGRTLRLDEGLRIADRQADLLRWQLHLTERPSLPLDAITRLPFLTVISRPSLGKSGILTKTERGWVIVVRADEPLVRQRFSICHELKHLLDDELLTQRPHGLYRGFRGQEPDELAERVCDRFAAALLMPKMLLRRDWTGGLQNVAKLARRYQVSTSAMSVRLRELGLIEMVPRCGGAAHDTA